MKAPLISTLVISLITAAADGQSIVNDTSYPSLFGPSSSLTVNPPNGGLLNIQVGGSASGPLGDYWTASATGGASVSLLGIGLTETGAQVALTGSSLEFNVSNSGAVGNLLDAGLDGLSASWTATAHFDDAGNQLLLAPNTIYRVSFDVDGSNGLLNSTLGITPAFSVQLLDGGGNAVGSAGSGTLVNIVGLLGTGVPTGRATVDFVTSSSVNSLNAASLRFNGSALLNATALGLGTNFATVSNVDISAVPEPSIFGLSCLGILTVLRRRR